MSKKHLITPLLVLAILTACGGKKAQVAKVEGLEIDSISVDSTLQLAPVEASPTCHVALHLQFVKGKKAEEINQALLRSGILTPDYFSLSDEKIAMKQAADSFVCQYMADYKRDIGELYRRDPEHPSNYNNRYIVTTSTQSDRDNTLTYVARVTTFGGGEHEMTQTIVRNFDVKTGRLITLSDVFKDDSEAKLKALIEQNIEEGKATDEIFVSDNFILTDDGITFLYSAAEIAPYETGEISVEIDKDQLKDLTR